MNSVMCPYCDERVAIIDGKTATHTDIYPTRLCEGGNRVVVGNVVSRENRTHCVTRRRITSQRCNSAQSLSR